RRSSSPIFGCELATLPASWWCNVRRCHDRQIGTLPCTPSFPVSTPTANCTPQPACSHDDERDLARGTGIPRDFLESPGRATRKRLPGCAYGTIWLIAERMKVL